MGTPLINRLSAGLLGLGCAALALWLCWHHPLAPMLATAGVLLLGAAQAAWPPLWLIALPALLPWLGLNPWSGWLLVEEVDLAILAVAAGAYLRWALLPGPQVRASRASRLTRRWGLLLLLLWTVSVAVSMHRGAVDAGGWSWGWWQGYREPMNALRLAKPTLAVLLLLPLWWRLQQRPGQRCADQLSLGLALGLGGTALWCIWERITGPGLLNMATDYRTTGPFWEMQVGGAALDIFLALSLPFAIRLVWTARSLPAMAGGGALVLAGAFAGFTTFSRIVYLALPVGLAAFALLQHRQAQANAGRQTPGQAPGAGNNVWVAAALCGGVVLLSVWLFPLAGYRGQIALLACTLSLLLLVPRSTTMPMRDWAGGWLLGLALSALVVPLSLSLGKGPYWAFAAATVATGALLLAPTPGPALRLLAVAGFAVQLGSLVAVALHWGGGPAALPAAVAATALAAAAWGLGRRNPAPWQAHPRWLAGTTTGLVVAMASVAVFSAGDFMAGRLSQTSTDHAERWVHWRLGLGLPNATNAGLLGQGLGRYPELYALQGPTETRPGDIRFGDSGVRMVAGNHPLGLGAMLRLSQRIALPPAGPLNLTLEARAPGTFRLVAEVCVKHLLYNSDCRAAEVMSANKGGEWQTLAVALTGASAVPAFPPRLIVFSLASDTARQPVDLRRIRLSDASGHDLLRNGTFADGGARWFITSDRNHLPWHAKNLGVHLLVEQGWLGLLSLSALTVAALASLLGPMRQHALAPPLVAALLGCWIVGAVDSVLDMPRVATWLLLLTGMALSLHLPSRAVRQPSGTP